MCINLVEALLNKFSVSTFGHIACSRLWILIINLFNYMQLFRSPFSVTESNLNGLSEDLSPPLWSSMYFRMFILILKILIELLYIY